MRRSTLIEIIEEAVSKYEIDDTSSLVSDVASAIENEFDWIEWE